jgi:hypothetical protein
MQSDLRKALIPHGGEEERRLTRRCVARIVARNSFKFEKRSQFFFATNDKPLSVAAMRICDKDRCGLRDC